jgi:glycosyltransferase involved in cell wall biosynthesis
LKKRLCLMSLPPDYYGGILSMMKTVYRLTQDDYDVSLCYSKHLSIPQSKPLIQMLRRPLQATVQPAFFHQMKTIGVESSFNSLSSFQYVDYKGLWKKTLQSFDLYFAVCGSAHAAYPLWAYKKSYGLWIATTYQEDLKNRLPFLSRKEQWEQKWLGNYLVKQERAILKKAQSILALSSYTKNQILLYGDHDEQDIQVVGYPIDVHFYRPAQVLKSQRIIFTGRFMDPRKNIHLLLRVLKHMLEEQPDVELYLVGDQASDDLKKTVVDLHLDKHVFFFERLDQAELLSFYQQSSIFVIPSWQEGLCIAALEAMSCGLPVVSTCCGGPQDFIQDGENGFLVPLDDEWAMTEKILLLFKMHTLRETMSVKARETILNHYSYQQIKPQFQGCLEYLQIQN